MLTSWLSMVRRGTQVALSIGSPLPRVAEPEDALQARLPPALQHHLGSLDLSVTVAAVHNLTL